MVRTLVGVAGVAVLLALAAWLPVDIPDRLTVPGRVLAAREWVLVREADSAIGALLRDNVEGVVRAYDITRFDRGDVVRFALRADLRLPAHIDAGDTLGAIHSNETEREMIALAGDLATVSAAVDVGTTGEKEAILREIRARIAGAEERVRQQNRVVDRLRRLHERALIPAQDLELAESQLSVYASDLAIARAQLEAAATGVKAQEVQLTRTEAAAIGREIATLRDRIDRLTLVSPIPGVATRTFGPDTLLSVRDTTRLVVMMAVPWRDYAALTNGQTVTIAPEDGPGSVEGRLLRVDDSVRLIGRDQVVLAAVALDRPALHLMPGSMTRCHIERGSLPLRVYLGRLFRSLLAPR